MSLAQLPTFRQEAASELALECEEITICASGLVEYTDDHVFTPEREESGTKVPPSWFKLKKDEGKDSVEEIAPSDEADEEDEDEGGHGVTRDGGATSRTRPDPA